MDVNKKLGFGLMRLPLTDQNDEASIDMEKTKQMVDLFLERGFTYFDTAWMYCGFNSENAARECLVSRHPRDSYTLASKLHSAFFNSLEERDKVFQEQLRKTGAGYFDYYLLHGIEAGSYPKYEQFKCFEWILDKKQQGLVKHAGFSFHDSPELLDEILTKHPEMEFVQLQINYLDWESEFVQSRRCYETAVRHGKKVIVMEPVKGGTLASVPEKAQQLLTGMDPEMSVSSWAVRFAASLPNVMVVLSGMSTPEQMDDNTSYMQDFKPLTKEQTDTLAMVADVINGNITVPCTGCSYCTDGCPMNIAIPKYFALYNEDMRESEEKGWSASSISYTRLTEEFGKAGDCIACGQCEGVCPQHLPIIRYLQDVTARFEG